MKAEKQSEQDRVRTSNEYHLVDDLNGLTMVGSLREFEDGGLSNGPGRRVIFPKGVVD